MKPFRLSRQSISSLGIALGWLAGSSPAFSQTNNTPSVTDTNNAKQLETVTVVGQLNQARSEIVPNLGATAYTITQTQIHDQSQGDNAPMNQVILRAPGVVEDSAVNGDLHVRGEHANLQYRIDDVLLPEGIAGFGLELDPRFIQSLQLITGSLPAEYGFRTAGVVDIQTKSGALTPGGDVGIYGGSYDTVKPYFQYGGKEGKWSYYVDGSYDHSGIGIENPTSSSTPIHDYSDELRTFMYGSYIFDATSRFTVMASAYYANYEVPNTPGLPSGSPSPANATYGSALAADGVLPGGFFNSSSLNENQREGDYYLVGTYQKAAGNLDSQLSVFTRESEQHFTPDPIGDLYFNGVASEVHRSLYSIGAQLDSSYQWGEKNTIRGGGQVLVEGTENNTDSETFNIDPGSGNPTTLTNIQDNHPLYGIFAGIYLQDEWKILPQLTLNVGGRFDVFESSFDDENQLSPRANLIYKPTDSTTLHIGYSRYFTPPPVENVGGESVAKFNGTANASALTLDNPVKAERANYYDAGISQKVAPGLTLGLDGYYKTAQNQLDDGLFGQTLILSAFNYAAGQVYGLEFTANYETNGFSAYFNGSYGVARGKDFASSQFLFSPADYAYSQNNWISLDHDQTFTASSGVSYRFKEQHGASTLFYLDLIAGSGLHQDLILPNGSDIPNGSTVPNYYEVNIGMAQTFQVAHNQFLTGRIDVVNVGDNIYELRSGSGVGVNAAQYGMRRGIFGTLSYRF